MISYLDPRLWLLLIALAGASYWCGDYRRGKVDAVACNGRMDKADNDALKKLNAANERYREAERAGQATFNNLTQANLKEKNDAKTQLDILRGKLRDGAERLSIRVAPDTNSGSSAGAVTDAGNQQARAYLLPADAEAVLDIAADADDVVRDLNSCVDKYSAAMIFTDYSSGSSSISLKLPIRPPAGVIATP
ncbi:Bacteriophage lysis protein [Herbaspirillum sp. CF444]|uniref:lysis system i-spanin subunit Rz n=1 Tax=Herbaspirillum sp. CF444 TaxID=1144319 RepID=UPI0002727E1B|nr:lysis system i-spanin subunit Rz [Herbaspirillum sp. CF444]EJL93508.1 Bacteriophage lysis protein [Herbaspirillum sp. CF444]